MSRKQCYPNVINDPSRVVIKHLSCHDIKTHVSSDLFVVEFSGSQPDVRFFGNSLILIVGRVGIMHSELPYRRTHSICTLLVFLFRSLRSATC